MIAETKAFIRDVHWEEIPEGYRVLKDLQFFVPILPEKTIKSVYYKLTDRGELYIYPGLVWDGASGPAIDTKTNMRSSLVHDVLIYMVQDKLLPDDLNTKWLVDSQYMRLSREDGMRWFRRWYHFFGIQLNKWNKKIRRVLKNG